MDPALLSTSLAFLQFRYEPTPLYAMHAAEAAEAVQRQASGELALPHWNPMTDGNHLLRSEDRKWLWMFGPQLTNIQVVGANRVYDNRTQVLALLGTTLDKMKPARIARVGFQVQSFIDLQMAFAEMVENFFGTLLPEKRALGFIAEELDDGTAEYIGRSGTLQFRLHVTPQSAEQVKAGLLANANLDLIQKDKFGSDLHEFWRSVDRPSLVVSLDTFQEAVDRKEALTFVQPAMGFVGDTIERVVKQFLSMPVRLGSR